jgi:glycosyltransferase involved in cell wall biosynthesis
MAKKLVYIISDIDKALEFEWAATYLSPHFDMQFILLNPSDSDLENFFKKNNLPVYRVIYRGKKDFIRSFKEVYKILKKIKPDIVHCHLLTANIIGLSAAKLAKVKKRIYTRHHSSYHHVYHKHGIIYDKLSNKLATDIVAISPIVKEILVNWEKVPEKKVKIVPHGLPNDLFSNVSNEDIELIKSQYNLRDYSPIIGVISRFTEWKGVQYIIPAFQLLLTDYPHAKLVLANAIGDYENEINTLLAQVPADSYIKINFEPNMPALFKTFNVFVHTPIDNHSEAFGQVYIEALAAGIPMVCTLSGIANECVKHLENAVVVDFKNSNEIYNGIKLILEDKNIREKLINNAPLSVKQYTVENKFNLLKNLYDE